MSFGTEEDEAARIGLIEDKGKSLWIVTVPPLVHDTDSIPVWACTPEEAASVAEKEAYPYLHKQEPDRFPSLTGAQAHFIARPMVEEDLVDDEIPWGEQDYEFDVVELYRRCEEVAAEGDEGRRARRVDRRAAGFDCLDFTMNRYEEGIESLRYLMDDMIDSLDPDMDDFSVEDTLEALSPMYAVDFRAELESWRTVTEPEEVETRLRQRGYLYCYDDAEWIHENAMRFFRQILPKIHKWLSEGQAR